MSDRTNVNGSFGYYINGNQLIVVSRNEDTGKLETYSGETIRLGLRINCTSKYIAANYYDDNLADNNKVDSGLHEALLNYVKSRLEEDMGNVDKSMYYKSKYRNKVRTYPHRKKGLRGLKVPHL